MTAIDADDYKRLAGKGKGLPSVTEAAFTRQVLALAKLRGWRTAHFRTACTRGKDGKVRYMTPVQGDGVGFPDLILVRGPVIVAAELKRDKASKAAPQQTAWLLALGGAGCKVFIWRPSDWPEIEEVLA